MEERKDSSATLHTLNRHRTLMRQPPILIVDAALVCPALVVRCAAAEKKREKEKEGAEKK